MQFTSYQVLQFLYVPRRDAGEAENDNIFKNTLFIHYPDKQQKETCTDDSGEGRGLTKAAATRLINIPSNIQAAIKESIKIPHVTSDMSWVKIFVGEALP